MGMSEGPVVVGVDASEQSVMVASWAVAEAELRRAEVRVVVVNDDPPLDETLSKMVHDIAQRCREKHPGLEIYEKVARGHAAAELIRRSAQAQLVVVGSRGRGAVTGALLGSVSTKVATHAHCPVVVVRDDRASGPVVVGVDSSPHSQAALGFAFDAAAARQTDLVAVQVWDTPAAEFAVVPPLDIEWETARDDAERSLAEQLAGWSEKYPNVAVTKATRRGHPVTELDSATRDAQLLVVGHRGSGGFAGLLLGSVAAGVLHHAHCPVAVIRTGQDDQQ